MTTKNIQNIVKFGAPLLTLLALLYAIFFVSNAGSDPEFGAIGASDSLLLLIMATIVLYIIAGIIVWIVTKKNFIFLSALFSALVIVAVFLIINGVNEYKKKKHSNEYRKKREVKLQKQTFKLDSLTQIINKNPKNYKAIEERALYYYIEVDRFDIHKDYEKDIKLLSARGSSNIKIYIQLSKIYTRNNDYDKAINMWKELKNKAVSKKIKFSEDDIKNINSYLKSVEEEKKQYLIKKENDKKWEEKQIKLKQDKIKELTEKFKNKGYNSKDLGDRGYAYVYLEMYEKALEDFNHALKLNSNNRLALVQRAHVLNKLGKYTQAIVAYKDLINRYPDNKKWFQKSIDKINKKIKDK